MSIYILRGQEGATTRWAASAGLRLCPCDYLLEVEQEYRPSVAHYGYAGGPPEPGNRWKQGFYVGVHLRAEVVDLDSYQVFGPVGPGVALYYYERVGRPLRPLVHSHEPAEGDYRHFR